MGAGAAVAVLALVQWLQASAALVLAPVKATGALPADDLSRRSG
jgi:hypothetical protein